MFDGAIVKMRARGTPGVGIVKQKEVFWNFEAAEHLQSVWSVSHDFGKFIRLIESL